MPGDDAPTEEARVALARQVRERRGALKLSVSRAARLAGVDRATWTGMEAATRVPQSHNRTAMERVLHWAPGSIDRVLAGAGSPEVEMPRPAITASEVRGAQARILAATPEQLVAMMEIVEHAYAREFASDVARTKAQTWLTDAMRLREQRHAAGGSGDEAIG